MKKQQPKIRVEVDKTLTNMNPTLTTQTRRIAAALPYVFGNSKNFEAGYTLAYSAPAAAAVLSFKPTDHGTIDAMLNEDVNATFDGSQDPKLSALIARTRDLLTPLAAAPDFDNVAALDGMEAIIADLI